MPNENSFWVLYGQHTKPTFLEDAGHGQRPQRDNALKHIKQWRVCLDIGSNIGQWTRPLAERFDSVVCFEPNPNFREFNSTVLKQGDGDIQCRTLDSFGLTNLDFIKIDVDGFEVPLLNGARETLSKNNAVINIEMKRDKRVGTVKVAEGILKDLGYRFVERNKSDEVWLKK